MTFLATCSKSEIYVLPAGYFIAIINAVAE